jgi:hypothetical protein
MSQQKSQSVVGVPWPPHAALPPTSHAPTTKSCTSANSPHDSVGETSPDSPVSSVSDPHALPQPWTAIPAHSIDHASSQHADRIAHTHASMAESVHPGEPAAVQQSLVGPPAAVDSDPPSSPEVELVIGVDGSASPADELLVPPVGS